jgi:uracil-DNA glycosylase
LGEISWRAAHAALGRRVSGKLPPRARFGHGAISERAGVHLLGSYHPSQLNTRTGRLTAKMFDSVLRSACELARL